MVDKKTQWNENQKSLKSFILDDSKFETAIKLCLQQHSMVHLSEMSSIKTESFEDDLWKDLDETSMRTSINEKGRTILYGLWHSARIEDITMNILVAGDDQVINTDNWLKRTHSPICTTGNELNPIEILEFSKSLDINEVRNYRIAVGRKSQNIIKNLKFTDLKRKFPKEALNLIIEEKAVSSLPAANWLVDFWSKKTVSGILLMPVTRHHIVHINECFKAKNKYLKGLNK
ncbi:DinB family protein [Clostridium sp. YIM B02505]|uniref:DinB family protein n=1 Tax=Clostridium yunnanense TaxID=2800325 RepID=A0ABS1ERX9_9CLOT|nr:DinB family protein [Clostridium yunnanense]MBK1812084.1 DinB family protein [Clostridium yunnanense]